ncbi:uncharacterized protein Dwil_GK10511 [Drosophila willistoni]|uniref:cyclin-dependent kinase n=1 Tax=Drosophila willistoni TaxID=7260 RepID=B4N4J7_DROWI|nr:uncharacterized protein Dwil_GK10511 [Drosophila willistoni]
MVNSSGSEDGQWRSPQIGHYLSAGDDDEHEGDGDALYIQPPQASRDLSATRREKKKHSRERRRHKDRGEDVGGGGEHRYGDYRAAREEQHYHHHHHRRERSGGAAEPSRHHHHHLQAHPQSYHYVVPNALPPPPPPSHHHHQHQHHHHGISRIQNPRGGDSYHHSYAAAAAAAAYHGTSARHADYPMEEPPLSSSAAAPRRTKDAESLEQDLRSRLLSKRHKYVKDYEGRGEIRSSSSSKEGRGDRERGSRSSHKQRHERVIELLDSPESVHPPKGSRRGVMEQQQLSSSSRRNLHEDPELVARREKLLAAERENRQRKQTAREELEARRELLFRERNEHQMTSGDALSPSKVAASVTAGLNIFKRKSYEKDQEKHRKRRKGGAHVPQHENKEDDDDDDDDDDDEESEKSDSEDDEEDEDDDDDSNESASDSNSAESYEHKKKTKRKNKSQPQPQQDNQEDNELPDLPDSPLSVGELYKSPPKPKTKPKPKHQHKQRSHSVSSSSSSSSSSSKSSRRSSRSRTSRSPSRSSIEEGNARSPSSSTRSEERGMSQQEDNKPLPVSETKALKSLEDLPPCDDKGVPLPNYYPGVQGCRSVEEFQCLNRIEEGTYGVVYRAKDKRTNEIVALKRLKMEKEKEGFPITSLREINTLLKGQHPNIVTVREIVVGSNMDKIFIVMDYVEHDLKSLMETMKNRKQSFFPGEVKCLTQQLLLAVAHLHDNWILHRDLKTSNLLLSHKGILKVGDFGLAREYGSPLKKYTSLVVTLWYRAPELLLCSPEYSTPIDVWSVGCIFAEFLQMLPLFPGKSEIDELNRIYKELGTPNEKIWPGYNELPAVKNMLSQNSQFTEYPVSQLRKHFHDKTSEAGLALLQGLLTYDPKQRLTADAALKHGYFKELPLPIDPSMFPTWPAKSELGARKAQTASSPKPPSGGSQFKQLGKDEPIATQGGAAGGGGGGMGSINTGNKLSSGIITGNKKSGITAGATGAANTGFVLNAGLTQRQLAMGPGFSLKF